MTFAIVRTHNRSAENKPLLIDVETKIVNHISGFSLDSGGRVGDTALDLRGISLSGRSGGDADG